MEKSAEKGEGLKREKPSDFGLLESRVRRFT